MFYLDLFRKLEDVGVRYLVVGGIAVNLHGVNRLTHDVDLMLALDVDAEKVRDWIENRHMLAFDLRPQNAVDPTVGVLVNSPVEFETAYARRVVAEVSGQRIAMAKAKEAEADKTVVDDYHYELSDEQLLHGLSMTPLQRLTWLDEARRFVLALRAAPRTYYEDGKPVRTVTPGAKRIY
jgi:hypothetical protein